MTNDEALMTKGMTKSEVRIAKVERIAMRYGLRMDADAWILSEEAPPSKQKTARVYDLEERTAKFGQQIIDFARSRPRSHILDPLVSQLVRAGTSPGANYCEADDAVSKKEFCHKIGTCKKEARETKYW